MKLSERIEKIAKTVEVQRHVKTARVSKEDADRLVELADDIYGKVDEVSRLLQRIDSHKYEAWKAYGKHVTSEFITMGLNLQEVVLQLGQKYTLSLIDRCALFPHLLHN